MSIESTHQSKTKFDAIVALGGGISPEGELSKSSQLRTVMAVNMFRQGLSSHIITSGKWSHRMSVSPPTTESEAMKNLAVDMGVEPQLVLTETTSQDTLGNAFYVKRQILKPLGWNSLAVITDTAHSSRALLIFERVMGSDFNVTVYPTLNICSDTAKAREANDFKTISGQLEAIPPGDDYAITRHFGYLALTIT